MTSISE